MNAKKIIFIVVIVVVFGALLWLWFGSVQNGDTNDSGELSVVSVTNAQDKSVIPAELPGYLFTSEPPTQILQNNVSVLSNGSKRIYFGYISQRPDKANFSSFREVLVNNGWEIVREVNTGVSGQALNIYAQHTVSGIGINISFRQPSQEVQSTVTLIYEFGK